MLCGAEVTDDDEDLRRTVLSCRYRSLPTAWNGLSMVYEYTEEKQYSLAIVTTVEKTSYGPSERPSIE